MLRLHSDSAGHALYQSIRWAACNQDLVLHLGSQIAARLAATGGGLPFASKFIRTQYRRRSDKLVAGKVKHKDGKVRESLEPSTACGGCWINFLQGWIFEFCCQGIWPVCRKVKHSWEQHMAEEGHSRSLNLGLGIISHRLQTHQIIPQIHFHTSTSVTVCNTDSL